MSSRLYDLLNDAVISNSVEIINFIFMQKKRASKEDLLHMALKNRNHLLFQFLLQRSADLNKKDETGKTVLELAIEYAFPEFVKTLLDYGASVNILTRISLDRYNEGYSLLHKAVQVGNLEIIDLLIKKGADVNERTKFAIHPLSCTCYTHNCYYYMMNSEIDFAFRRTLSVLDVAIICNPRKGNSVIDFLCKKGAAVEIATDNYFPLHLAVLERAHIEKIEKLIQYGANINSICENLKYTPLSHAILTEDQQIVYYLIKKGADFHKSSINSVLQKLVLNASPKTEEFLGILLDYGADINSKTEEEKTPLHIVVSNASKIKNYFKLFLDYGSDINAQDKRRNTPLHSAIRKNNFLAVQVLIEYDANLACLNMDREYPLKLAIQKIVISVLTSKFRALNNKSDCNLKDIFSPVENEVLLIIQAIIVNEVSGRCKDKQLLDSVRKKFGTFYDAFLEEVQDSKLQEIENGISYFDILSKNADFVESYLSGDVIKNVASSDIGRQFPFYGEMIKMRFSKIKERRILVEKSGAFFESIFRLKRHTLPIDVRKNISAFLSFPDLINLWRVCKRPGEFLSTLLERPFV